MNKPRSHKDDQRQPASSLRARLLLLALTATWATAAPAQKVFDWNQGGNKARDSLITEQPAFVAARRDVLHRQHGIRHFQQGHYGAAAESFRIAARYADKFSQAAYAEMLWEGHPGVPQNRPLAYAWMDLAAERGSHILLAKREAYWEVLSEDERAQALKVGQGVYEEYGDDVAKPRQERVMAKARRTVTGSRVGAATKNLRIVPAEDFTVAGTDFRKSLGIPGHEFFNDRFWAPHNHWAHQDVELEQILSGTPTVEVGELEVARDNPPARKPPNNPAH